MFAKRIAVQVLPEHYFKIGTSHGTPHHLELACDIGLYVNGKFDEVGEHYKFKRNLARDPRDLQGTRANPMVPHTGETGIMCSG